MNPGLQEQANNSAVRRFLSTLFSLNETVNRTEFAVLGLGLFVFKYFLDWCIATIGFGLPWSPAYYIGAIQGQLFQRSMASSQDPGWFLPVLLFAAIPFVAAGVALTVKRLRSAGLPVWLAILFFAPMITFAFFLLLIILAPRPEPAKQKVTLMRSLSIFGWLPHVHPKAGFATTASLTAFLGLLLTAFNVFALGVYGVGPFVGLPFCLGIIGAVLHGNRSPRPMRGCVAVAVATVATCAAMLLVTAFEGIICILMAAPIWLVCAILGGVVGHYSQRYARDESDIAVVVIGLTLAVPALMGAEASVSSPPSRFRVVSSVQVNASPQTVWRHVVSFPRLREPDEWIFRAGVAYPIGATIVGTGVGAERRCHFSTGTFVEPLLIWEEPKHLQFSVAESPPPMRELSIYADIHPPHLSGLLNSRAGEFRLTPLPDGGTRLDGTTWYEHGMGPEPYWRFWSNWNIHRIHLRVLEHVRTLAETESATRGLELGESITDPLKGL